MLCASAQCYWHSGKQSDSMLKKKKNLFWLFDFWGEKKKKDICLTDVGEVNYKG